MNLEARAYGGSVRLKPSMGDMLRFIGEGNRENFFQWEQKVKEYATAAVYADDICEQAEGLRQLDMRLPWDPVPVVRKGYIFINGAPVVAAQESSLTPQELNRRTHGALRMLLYELGYGKEYQNPQFWRGLRETLSPSTHIEQ